MYVDILFAAWFFLAAGVANVAPILAARLPLLKDWNTPIDFGKMYKGKRILGDHKTWRGIASGVVAGTSVFYLQKEFGSNLGIFDGYANNINFMEEPLILGSLLGFGALAGDAVKSFFKRQNNIASGASWVPYDQLDYIVGGILFASFLIILPLKIYLIILFIWLAMHIIFSYIGFKLQLKTSPI